MTKTDYGNVRVLLVLENPIVRQGLRDTLKQAGFPKTFDLTTADSLNLALNEENFDLIVMTTEVGEDFVAPLIGDLREGRLSHHPFPVVIQLLMSSEKDYVRKVIDSGPDDILRLPVAPGQILARAAALTQRRRPFVVTLDYTGPDRRQENRPASPEVPLVEVPNPLSARVNRTPEDVFHAEVERSRARLRSLKRDRYALELLWLDRAVQQLFQEGPKDTERLAGFAQRLKAAVQQVPELVAGARVADLARHLQGGADILARSGFAVDARVLQRLSSLQIGLAREIRSAPMIERPDPRTAALFGDAGGEGRPAAPN
jgi:DNA-binding response OmpR family regulator